MLGARPGDADRIGLLKPVGADHEGRNLTRQHHNRNRIHQRIDQTRHRIGRARPRGHQCDTHLAGGARIALGHMDRALFMAHQHVLDVVLLEDLVIDRQHRAAGIAKDHLHALIFQGLNHHSCAGHRLCHRSFLILAAHPAALSQQKAPGGLIRGRMGAVMGCRYRPMRHSPTITFSLRIVAPQAIEPELRGRGRGRQPQIDV